MGGEVALALIVAALIAGYLLTRHRARGWTAVTAGNDYGAKVDKTGSFDFPLSPASIHYVTKGSPSLKGKRCLRMRYRIDAEPGVRFCPPSYPSAPSIGPTLYLQRKGDDWSGAGKFESFRWWATFASPTPIWPGEHEVYAPFDEQWTAVMKSDSMTFPEEFAAALENVDRVGFTFGGATGYGHGIFATGKARFTLLEFTAE